MRARLLTLALCLAAARAGAAPTGDVFAGVGGGAFNQELGALTEGGFAFNARVGADWRYLGVEASYQGLRAHSDAGLTPGSTDESAFSGILGGHLRANLPVATRSGLVKPYLLGGVGWSRVTSDNLLGPETDDTLAVPLGVGTTFTWKSGVGLDGRFVYNLLTGERSPAVATGDAWTANVSLGYRWGG